MGKRILLLGAGRIGATHAETIASHPEAILRRIVDVRADAARELASRFGVDHGSDSAAAVNAAEIDAVMIASSTDSHVEIIELAAAAKKPIFCEKPIDLNLARVEACLARVKEAGVPLQIGFNRRFDPHFTALQARLRNKEIGQPEIVRITSRDPAPPPMDYVKVSGGLFRDMMIHDFDTARWLLGDEPVSLHATASNLVDPAIGEAGDVDTAVVTLKMRTGALCILENSRRAVYGYDQRIEVHGSKGMLQADNPLPSTVSRWQASGRHDDRMMTLFIDRYADAYRAELDHFLEVIDGATPSPNGDDGRIALMLAEAAVGSLESGRSVEVEVQ